MFYKKKDIFHNLNFNTLYPDLVEVVKEALEKYWEINVSTILEAVNDYREIRDEYLVKNTDFFSNQIKVEKHKPIMIRLSSDFANYFLSSVLKEKMQDKVKKFKLTDLTQLEIKILNNFSEFLFKRIREILIPASELKLSEESEKYFNFIFMLGIASNKCSKIVISIPQDRIKKEILEPKPTFTDEDFYNSKIRVRIKAGYTKLTLEELKNLTVDDIVVLDESNTSSLILVSGEIEKKFKVKSDPSLVLNLDDNDTDEIYDEVIMEKNLWDDIQIELSAEFEKVKMTIGELKQIVSGQIVDLGSVFNTEIALFVEDRKVAKGDLIIVNDHYAIKLNEVLSSGARKNVAAPKSVAQEAPKTPPPNANAQAQEQVQAKPQNPQTTHQVSQDEEFDYSDFEK